MNLHKVIVRPGIRTSERFGKLNFFERDMYYGLLNAGNGKDGWFEFNVTVLRAALFAPCLGKVSERDVKAGLLRLQEGRLIKLWTGKNGRAYGQIINYRQTFDYGEPLPPDAHPPPDDELPLGATTDPPPRGELNRDELKGGGGEIENPPAPNCAGRRKPNAPIRTEEQPAWLARLQVEWPDLDITAEALKAERERRLKGKMLERQWFEDNWLPKCSPAVVNVTKGANGSSKEAEVVQPEPERWRVWLKDRYNGQGFGSDAERYEWPEMPGKWRAKILREMNR